MEELVVRRLREAVWADPTDDAPRMVYADHLLARGDALGELIALQLQRARTGAAISERELELVVAEGKRMLAPIELWLRRWVLARGFLSAATLGAPRIPREATHHPVWSTVERLTLEAGADVAILESPHLRSLRTLHADERLVSELARGTVALPLAALSGPARHTGLALGADQLEVFEHRGAFARVRELSLSAWWLERALGTRDVLTSRLIGQLDHLDLTFPSVRLDDLRMWRRWADTTRLARVSVQVAIASEPSEWEVPAYAYVELTPPRDTAILQLEAPTEQADDVLAVLAEVAGDHRRFVVEDTRDPVHARTRHAHLLDALARRGEVIVTTGPVRPRVP